jgi:DNA polymerase V
VSRNREEHPLPDGRLESAGFPSPAADYLDMGISLDRSLIDHPEATFFFRAAGAMLEDAGIFDGDLLVVDRAVTPCPGHLVVAVADGEFVLRRVRDLARETLGEVNIWGVVRWAIHRLCPSP